MTNSPLDNRSQAGWAVLPAGPGRVERFREPVETVVARDLAEVRPALDRVARAADEGLTAVGALAYHAAPAFDPSLRAGDADLPRVWFGLYEHSEIGPAGEPPDPPLEPGPWASTITRGQHAVAVDRVRAAIAAGETYQVNLTHRLRTAWNGDPLGLAAQLWGAQPTAVGAYLDLGEAVLVSASPELFFRLDGRRIESHPMKGTRRRGRGPADDQALAHELAASPKDRAENLMIVDMIRNDLGRIAEVGSVAVPSLFEVVALPTVWQMISRVVATSDAGLADIVAALFPCASITGAPKVRTMRLIDELETTPRGFYCGAIGVVRPGRRAWFNVAIRTLTLDRRTGVAEYGVGGGVVWDSTADAEWDECQAKAALLAAPGRVDLLETLAWSPDCGWLLLEAHRRRLRENARRHNVELDEHRVIEVLESAVDGRRSAQRVRLTVDRGGVPRAVATPLPEPRRWRVALSDRRVDSHDPRLGWKTTDRRLYDVARAARPDCDDVLLVNERGELTEGTLANLVVRLDGRLVTPPVGCGLLPGVYREALLRIGWIREGVVTVADLDRADGLWLVNSVRGWIPADRVR